MMKRRRTWLELRYSFPASAAFLHIILPLFEWCVGLEWLKEGKKIGLTWRVKKLIKTFFFLEVKDISLCNLIIEETIQGGRSSIQIVSTKDKANFSKWCA